ncbi:CD79B protein, partial [Fregata magnificens]|nr:CD79B protein [Fregata magnificens]
MADLCTRLWVLQANLWLMAVVTGGMSADKNNTRSGTGGGCPMVQQHPRYVAAKKNMPIYFVCYSQESHSMQWYKMADNSHDFYELDHSTSRYNIERKDNFINFTIFRTTYEDNGIYVCDSKNLTAEKKKPHLCGTELRVMGHSNIQQIQSRNTLKDAIIIIQSILLVIFLSVPMLLFLDKVSDGISSSKESPEEDHTYEGLEVEQMATYEDITPFRDVKAKWTVGEHPGEE